MARLLLPEREAYNDLVLWLTITRERLAMIFKLDKNDDMAVENGSWVMIEGDEEIEQNLKQRLRYFLGEWFLDQRNGIPYFEQILIKNFNPNIVDAIFKNTVLATPGIIELTSFLIDFDSKLRKMSLSFKARTIKGILTIKNFGVP